MQNALKHMLTFGTVTRYLGYSALKVRFRLQACLFVAHHGSCSGLFPDVRDEAQPELLKCRVS